jgi:hypothetical protein
MAVVADEKLNELDERMELRKYTYRTELAAVIEGEDEPVVLSDFVTSTELYYDLEGSVFPFFAVRMMLPRAQHLTLQGADEKTVYLLSLVRFDPEDEESPHNEKIYDSIVMKAVDPERASLDPSSEGDPESGREVADNIPQHKMTLYLFKRDHLFFNKLLNPMVLNTCSLPDAVSHLIGKNFRSSDMRFHVGPMDNRRTYEQIIVPPYNFIDSLRYLQKVYGMFNNGLQVFFDFLDAYVMDPFRPVERKDPSYVPTTTVELYSKLEVQRATVGFVDGTFLDEESDSFIVRTSRKPRVEKPQDTSKELVGERVHVGSSSQTENVEGNCMDMTFGSAQNDPRRPKESFYWNPYSTPLVESGFKATASQEFHRLTMALPEADLEAFLINRTYRVEDKNDAFDLDLKGEYKLSRMRAVVPQAGAGSSPATAEVTLKRVIHRE